MEICLCLTVIRWSLFPAARSARYTHVYIFLSTEKVFIKTDVTVNFIHFYVIAYFMKIGSDNC